MPSLRVSPVELYVIVALMGLVALSYHLPPKNLWLGIEPCKDENIYFVRFVLGKLFHMLIKSELSGDLQLISSLLGSASGF